MDQNKATSQTPGKNPSPGNKTGDVIGRIPGDSSASPAARSLQSRREFFGRHSTEDASRYSVTIGASPEEVFKFYRDFNNLPTFMKDLKEIKVLSQTKSHWTVEIKGGLQAEWDAEIIEERAGEALAWRSVEGSEVKTSGAVFFEPAQAGLGTIVSLALDYQIPGGKLAELFTLFTGDNPSALAFVNLRRLKARIETGEVPTIEGQSSGRDPGAETVYKH